MPNEVNLNENSNLNLNEVNLNENSNKNDPLDSYRTVLDAFCDNFKEHYVLDLYSTTEKIKLYNHPIETEKNRIQGILNRCRDELMSDLRHILLFIKDYRKVNEDIKKGKKYGLIQFYKASLQQLYLILADNRNVVNTLTKYLDYYRRMKFGTYYRKGRYMIQYKRFESVYEEYAFHRNAWFGFLESILPDYKDMFPNSTEDIPDIPVHVNGTSVENNAVPIGNLSNKTSKGKIPKAKQLRYTRETRKVRNFHRPRPRPVSPMSSRPQRIEKNTLVARRRANETRRAIQSRPVHGIAMNG